jgi:preprotein translocase subunit YajC
VFKVKVRLFLASQLTALSAFADAAKPGQPGVGPLVPLILIFGVFYFLVMRPQQKKQKLHETFLKELKRGDMVVTSAGIIGTVKILSDRFVTIEVDEGVTLKILRSAIAENAASLKQEPNGNTKPVTQTT